MDDLIAGCVASCIPRPNIVVRGGKAFAEDTWGKVTIGDEQTLIECVKPCTRCKIPTVDPITGVMNEDNQPIKAMKRLRSGQALKFKREDWRLEVSFLFPASLRITTPADFFREQRFLRGRERGYD